MERRSFVLTVPAVEFGEGRRVAAGQLGGAPEGRGRQTGDQRGVARLCRPITEEQEQLETGLYLQTSDPINQSQSLSASKCCLGRVKPSPGQLP